VKLSEDEIRKLTLQAIEQLGENATPEEVKKVVASAIGNLNEQSLTTAPSGDSGRVILTSFGMNHPGIVSGITTALSEALCDIQDISQKLMGDFYTMIMIIDITNSEKDLKSLQEEMNAIASKLKVKIYLQHEDVFKFMHRI
jgi:ACT domain-containing protein